MEAPGIVLLVEDDLALQDSVCDLLESEGFDVVGANDGREALDLLRVGLRPSVIVLDITMPRMDGWDFRHVQMADLNLRDIPVIVTTSAGFRTENIRSQFGDVHFLPKPLDAGAFLATLTLYCRPHPRSPSR